MDKKRTHAPNSKAQRRTTPLAAPMAQQRAENCASSTQQGLVRLIGCHDPAKRHLPGKPADSRSAARKSLIE
jgi:hypothetical protein